MVLIEGTKKIIEISTVHGSSSLYHDRNLCLELRRGHPTVQQLVEEMRYMPCTHGRRKQYNSCNFAQCLNVSLSKARSQKKSHEAASKLVPQINNVTEINTNKKTYLYIYTYAGLYMHIYIYNTNNMCIYHVYIYLKYIYITPPRPTFCVADIFLNALSSFLSYHLLQHSIRKVSWAHAPGHILPTYVAAAQRCNICI